MKKTLPLLAAAAFLAACATPTATETAPAAEAADKAPAEADMEDCDPADESCDHSGTVIRPPTQ